MLRIASRDMIRVCIACVLVALAYSTPPVQYHAWDRAMKAHVSSSGELDGVPLHTVNYPALAADPDFKAFVASLEHADTHGLSKNDTYALFMNAYNALAMKMIIDHPCKHNTFGSCTGPISSIKDIGLSPISPVWTKEAGKIGGKQYSLQQIEDFLRDPKPFDEDARLHACIVCASISCPNVRVGAFHPESIDAEMTDQMRDMLSNKVKGFALDRASKTVTLSRIFSWYAGDFSKAAGSVLEFILPYVPDEDRSFIVANKADITLAYFGYDWNANGKIPCNCSGSTANLLV